MRPMKDSGVEWIGEIPENWSVGKTLYGLSMPITDGPHETPELLPEGIPFVSAEAVSCGNGHIDFSHIRGYISQEFYNECCKKYIPKINDVYMIKSGATTGRVAKVETSEIFTIWSPLAVFRCNEEKCHYNYLYYFVQSDAYQKQIENKWSYGTQQNIGMRTLEKLMVCFPTIIEQRRIADYLDAKCAKIDALIAKQQEIIEKLKAYKLSAITEAVTKGLNPNVPMKESGLAWCKYVPESWQRVKLKDICTFHNGDRSSNYPSPEDYVEDGIPFVGADSLWGDHVDTTISKHISTDKYAEMGGLKIKENDILYTLRGSTIGKNAIAGFSEGTVASSLMGIRAKAMVNAFFLYYWLNSNGEYIQRDMCINGSTAPNLSAEDVKLFVLYLPSTQEQLGVVAYIKQQCSKIDATIQAKEKVISKIAEYKKSLIYEVVTGKREV